MQRTSSVIHLANITKAFGDTVAVNDVSLRVAAGEIIGFVGPNGAGKTTAIALLMGFLRATEGTVTLFGREKVTPASAHRTHRRIGFVSGDMALPEDLSGKQYLQFMAARQGSDAAMTEALHAQLKPQLIPKIGTLSRGNQQKIALIAALAHKPELIILDEPTSGLDPLMQQKFLKLIADAAAGGATVLMSSHILSEVADVCTRIMFMKQGRIISDQTISEIRASAGRLVRITGSTATIKEAAAHLPHGASPVVHTTDELQFSYAGSEIKPLLRWLAPRNFTDVDIRRRELDDIFMDLYREGSKK